MTALRSAFFLTVLLVSGCAHVPRTHVGATTLEGGESALTVNWDHAIDAGRPTLVRKAPGVERVELVFGDTPGVWDLEWATATGEHSFRLVYSGPLLLGVAERVDTVEDRLTGNLSYRPAAENGGAPLGRLGFAYKTTTGGFDLRVEADGRLTLVAGE